MKRTQEEINEMREMRFKHRMTLKEIGKEFNLTRERIRQLIGNSGRFVKPLFKFTCSQCKKEEELTETNANLSKKYCNRKCYSRSMWLNSDKPIKEYNADETKAYNKKRNEKTKEARHQWYLKNKEKCKERNKTPEARAYFKEYFKRPEVIERINKRQRERYQNDTEYRKKMQKIQRESYLKRKQI